MPPKQNSIFNRIRGKNHNPAKDQPIKVDDDGIVQLPRRSNEAKQGYQAQKQKESPVRNPPFYVSGDQRKFPNTQLGNNNDYNKEMLFPAQNLNNKNYNAETKMYSNQESSNNKYGTNSSPKIPIMNNNNNNRDLDSPQYNYFG